MRLRYKVMPKANPTSWLVVSCLALLAMPLMAQQAPATPDAVRKALNPPAPTQPAAGANPAPQTRAASAGAASPNQAQTPKPVTQASSAIKPAPSTPKASAGSVPSSPAGSATSSVTAKPASKPATKPSDATVGPKAAPRTAGSAVQPGPGAGSKVASGTEPSSAAKSPGSNSVTVAKSDLPPPATAPSVKPVAVRENISRRDPFAPLLGRETSGGSSLPNLPPGKPGLLIGSLRIDGIVSGPSGMIAIVSNTQDRVYFLREGDHLYDGQVEHITMAGISFHQSGKDPFGNAVEREVAKRLNSTPGEQQ